MDNGTFRVRAIGADQAPAASIAVVDGEFAFEELLDLPRRLDRAAVAIASSEICHALADRGVRVPLVEAEGADADEVAARVAAAHNPQAVPELTGGRLVAGSATRRFAAFGEASGWEMDSVLRRIAEINKRVQHQENIVYAEAHAKRFAHTSTLLPKAAPGGSLLQFSSFFSQTPLLEDLGYWTAATSYQDGGRPEARVAESPFSDFGLKMQVGCDVEVDRIPVDDEIFDVVLATEIIEHLPRDPMQLLCESNRVLRTGGLLVMTTPNIVGERAIRISLEGLHPGNYYLFSPHGSLDRHHFEWTPALLGRAVRSAGFSIETLTTEFLWWDPEPAAMRNLDLLGHHPGMRGDNIILVARKTSTIVDRTPPFLYAGDSSTWVNSLDAQPRVPL